MREAEFQRRKKPQWQAFEQVLGQPGSLNPDVLSDLFVQVTDDLSYAKTYYGGGQSEAYLNHLAARVHQSIYRNKKERGDRIMVFWTREVPMIVRRSHWTLLYALLFFSLFVLIGVISTRHDETFPRLILGDGYVNMTQHNIQQGKPMAVYDSMNELEMFFAITWNNIRVSFVAYAAGLFTSIGTIIVLLFNGIMLGTFQYFFYKYDLLLDSMLTIWIHGTIEISVIVVAGGAGLLAGNSILFPGTYSRGASFLRGAKNGAKIVISLIPFFIIAGFLESFATRHTEWHWSIRLAIILSSLALILWYFVWHPYRMMPKIDHHGDYQTESELSS